MSRPLYQKNWPWAAAALVVVVLFLLRSFSIEGPIDVRRSGGLEEVEALALRDDVNVLFILVDTLRSDHLGSYGYERDTSPNFDALAERGVRFGRHLAQSSWTKSSMASLWTGLYPKHSGVTRLDHGLPDEAIMPAEVFKAAGFRTVGLWRNGWVSPTFGFAQGFDVYHRPVPGPVPQEVRRNNPTVHLGGSDMDLQAAAEEFLRIAAKDRWFLYLHLMDVHEYMYSEDTALFGTHHADIYDNSIRYTSNLIGQLVANLKETGQLERTLIVLGSDHGEAFRERGLEGHARKVYRESTEVPFILSLPFKLDPGVVIETQTYNIDVWPTVFDLLGLPMAKAPALDGVSRRSEILAALGGDDAGDRSSIGYADLDQHWGRNDAKPSPTVAVVDHPYRYVFAHRASDGTIREELFDSNADPAELEDVFAIEPERAGRYRKEAEAYLASEPVWESEVPSLELDELELNHLRALGYAIP